MSRSRARLRALLVALALGCAMSCIAAELRAEEASDDPGGEESSADLPSDEVAAARRHFERGVEFFRQERFEAAITAFRTSYDINPLPQVLFNIAVAQRDLGRGGAAMRTLRRYLAVAANEPEERREVARALIDELDDSLATVRLRGRPAGADVSLDGQPWGTLPLDDPLRVNEGDHELEIRHRGFRTHRESFAVAASEEREIEIQLAEDQGRWYRSWWFWTIVGVAVAGTATGVTLHYTLEPQGAEFDTIVVRGGSR